MTDFFTRIAQQHRAHTPLLQPVLRTVFAPFATAVDAAREPDATVPSAQAPVRWAQSATLRVPAAGSEAIEPHRAEEPRSAPDDRAAPARPAASRADAAAVAAVELHTQLARPRAATTAAARSALVPPAPQRAAQTVLLGAPQPRAAAARQQAAACAPVAAVRPTAGPLNAERAQALMPARAAAAAPVVHVHIDRIEVRGAPAPARAAPSAAPRRAAVTSLADYLRGGRTP